MAEISGKFRNDRQKTTGNSGSWKDSSDKLQVSEDFKATRAKEPIFGPAVPAGEEFAYVRKECTSHIEVQSALADVVYDVLNGFMPQAKGEFVLRALGAVTKSLAAASENKSLGTSNQALAQLLEKRKVTRELESKNFVEKVTVAEQALKKGST